MSLEDLLKALQSEYLASLPAKAAAIRIQVEASSVPELRDSFHKLKGTGRTYGLPEVSELGEAVERVCLGRPGDALAAAGEAVSILADIHSARQGAAVHDLGADPRFARIRQLLPAS